MRVQGTKVVVLAGGRGRRLQDERIHRPKPLVEICGRPLVCHVMDIFSDQGFTDFVVALGHGAQMVKDHFREFPAQFPSSWAVELCDTGVGTGSAGRLNRLNGILDHQDRFLVTYCDGLAPVDLPALLEFHTGHDKLVTMTTVHPPGRFGVVGWDGDAIQDFREKPPDRQEWINGGFFVVERSVLDSIAGDTMSWERDVLPGLAAERQLMGYRHEGFFAAVDTPKDRDAVEELLAQGNPPWRQQCLTTAS